MSTGEYLLRREFNIGGIHFQSDVARYYDSSRTNMSVRSILRGARFRDARGGGEKRREKKNSRHPPFLLGSLILTTMTPAVRELTWTRKFPFATYGKYFPKTRKASPNPRRV